MKKNVITVVFILIVLAATAWSGESKKKENLVYSIQTNLGDIEVELFQNDAPDTVANFIGLAEGTKEFTDIKTGEKVKKPFYDGLIFHRVIKGFMIQGGCPQGDGRGGPGYSFADEINAAALGLDKLKAMDPKEGPHPFLMIRSQEDYQNIILAPLFKKMGITSQKELDQKRDELEIELKALTLKKTYENMGYSYSDKGSSHSPVRGSLAMANSGPNTNGSQFFINLIDTDWLTGKHTVFGKVIKGMDVVDKIEAVTVDNGSKPVEDVKIISIRRNVSQ
ncbi:MAG: peptidylprolyl isomerase [Deltaproteobacteria bacterium]|nr:peptidylprolyl isomerase [Deltaproteobacteria bacterium]MBW2660504.1 peptidylprolyl isomerase [Deltaproteobacteria bacterium]